MVRFIALYEFVTVARIRSREFGLLFGSGFDILARVVLIEDRQVLLRLDRGDEDVKQTEFPGIRRIGGGIGCDGPGTFVNGEIDGTEEAQYPYHHGRRLHAQ